MTDNDTKTLLPEWALATDDTEVSAFADDRPLTPERLADLRGALAVMDDQPIATLEEHPLPEILDRRHGIPLSAASPLAQNLSQLISRSATKTPAVLDSGDLLYRMVIPAKVAREVGQGLVRPMAAKGEAGGVHSALVNSNGIAAQAAFVPAKAASVGAVGGAGAAGAAAIGGMALTIAAPLVLMALPSARARTRTTSGRRPSSASRTNSSRSRTTTSTTSVPISGTVATPSRRHRRPPRQGQARCLARAGLGRPRHRQVLGGRRAPAEAVAERLGPVPAQRPIELDVVTDAFAGIEEGAECSALTWSSRTWPSR